jgi:hypothetical protein
MKVLNDLTCGGMRMATATSVPKERESLAELYAKWKEVILT